MHCNTRVVTSRRHNGLQVPEAPDYNGPEVSDVPSNSSAEIPSAALGQAPSAGSGQALYRKWRPQSFAEVSGQDPITRTLRNSVASGRLAHAYLFCGPRGTGKTSLGRLLAKAANCASPVDGEPCNRCDSCVAFIEGRAMDFVEQDAASHNSVDDIRQLRENVILTPMSGGRKVYLLDEVHMLSNSAENALLKTLEEPPPHIIFVLATTEPHRVSSTIISRCQRFDLRRIPASAAVDRLAQICQAEGFTLDQASLEEMARASTGSLRDAVNALEQVVTYYGRSPSYEQVQEALGLSVDARSGQLAGLALQGDLAEGLKLIAAVRDDGVDVKQFAKQIVRYLRNLLLAKAGAFEVLDLPQELIAEVKAEASRAQRSEIVRALRAFGGTDFRDDPQSSLPLELAFVEFVSEGAPAATQPEATAPTAPEPRFSMPVAELDEVASTVTTARVEPPLTEEPSPEPEPATAGRAAASAPRPATSGDGDLLERVRQAARATDTRLAALLNGSCEVKSADGDTVVLGFYHTFHLERIESGTYAGRLAELFSQALGRAVRVVYEHAPRQRREPPAAASGGHLVRAAQELLGTQSETEGGQNEPRRDEP